MKKALNNFKGVYMEIIGEVPDNVGWNTTRCRLVSSTGIRPLTAMDPSSMFAMDC